MPIPLTINRSLNDVFTLPNIHFQGTVTGIDILIIQIVQRNKFLVLALLKLTPITPKPIHIPCSINPPTVLSIDSKTKLHTNAVGGGEAAPS
ncbi:MAG: hypothetical protein WBX01_12240 [Nitrososphaeraceae archaeon]|jgi:hypothetical protein